MSDVNFSDLCGFFEKQWEATRAADARLYTLYGGARGPGKSYWLRWYALRFLLRHASAFPNMRVGLFCENYPVLKDRQVVKIATEFPPWLGQLGTTNSEGLGYHLKTEYGGGHIALRNLDDPSKYKSSEYALIAVDELTQNPEPVFHILRGSMRWPNFPRASFVAATNPDGPGRDWVRALWIEHSFRPELAELAKQADQFIYVPGSPNDNKHLDPTYWAELNSQPEKVRRAWLEGDWYVTMEGAVYEEFADENLTTDEPDPSLPIELAFDDGYIDPRAFLFIQRQPTRILVFAEMYHTQHLAETCVQEALELCACMKLHTPVIAIGSHEARELWEHFRKHNIPARGTPSPIVERINVVRRLVLDENGQRPLQVNYRCKNFIQEITEGYCYAPTGSKKYSEVPIDARNHACDALGQWAWLRARR